MYRILKNCLGGAYSSQSRHLRPEGEQMELAIFGKPITKKNHMKIIKIHGHYSIVQGDAYRKYEKIAIQQISGILDEPIECPVNVEMVYYMPTRRRVDLVNLQEATLDILHKGGILADDNCKIVVSMDGSRVFYDKDSPRVEINIKEVEKNGFDED